MRVFLLLAALPLLAGENADQIVKRLIAAERENSAKAEKYTFVEQVDHFSFDKAGIPKKFASQTYENVFIEGKVFEKLVARNDKPLEAKEAAKVKKKMEEVAAQRRLERHSTLTHKVVSMGSYDDLLTLFDNSLLGEEELNGHNAWIVFSKAKPDHVPATDHEKEVMSFDKKLWIDKEENQILRSLSTVTGKHIVFMPGTTVQFDFDKIGSDAWMQTSGLLDGHLQFAKLLKPKVRTEYKYTNFQKFDVQSTITTEPIKP